MIRYRVILATVAAAMALTISAQSISSVEQATSDPLASTTGRGAAPQLAFVIDQDSKTVKLQFGRPKNANTAWALTLSGPLDSKNDKTSLATLDGLDNGVSVEGTVNHTFALGGPPIPLAEFTALCEKYKGDKSCNKADLPDYEQARLDRTFPVIPRVGFSAKVAHKNFDYFETSGTATSVTRNGSSVGASAGIITSNIPVWLLYYGGLSVKHEVAYKAGDDAQFCQPIPNSTGSKCKTLPLGTPSDGHSTSFTVDFRQFFGMHVAAAPRAQYVSSNKKAESGWSFTVPVYVRQSAASPFSGGLNFTWSEKTKKIGVGLFVAALPVIK